jgi:hypothetical protein
LVVFGCFGFVMDFFLCIGFGFGFVSVFIIIIFRY